MAEFGGRSERFGDLELGERQADGVLVVSFNPTSDALHRAGRKSSNTQPVKLAEIDRAGQIMRVFPVVTLPDHDRFLEPKYAKIRCIQVPFEEPYFDLDQSMGEDGFIEMLTEMPRGLIRDPQYGLGIGKENAVIIGTIEKFTDCNEIMLSGSEPTHVDGTRFVFSLRDFENLRAELNRIVERGRSAVLRVKAAQAHNWLAPVLGIGSVPINRGRHPMVQALADSAANARPLTDEEQDRLVDATVHASVAIAKRRPEALMKLASDIELVTLEALIERFRAAISVRKPESFWQRFFTENPFALHLAFGTPVVLVQAQASVGGRRLSGEGEKLADFVSKNALTGNLAIFEIKRPDTKLLDTRSTYRAGLYGPSKELIGAISQVLDQRQRLEETLPILKTNSREWSLQAYAVRCCVIAGQIAADDDQKKSFELFRGNSRNVDVVTYDELLTKLEQLRDILGTAAEADGRPRQP